MGVNYFDQMLDALGDIQRRRVLIALLEAPDDSVHATGSETATESGVDGRSMRHVHLPKLEHYEFVDWDRDAHVVRTGDRFDEIEPLLELLIENERRLSADWI